ncbi:hypothetical protein FRC08_017201 [Ceratobasidium sp. 394]|nr:hypothetical protein FRC08_017201 [Ceratobasidium sp. 394]
MDPHSGTFSFAFQRWKSARATLTYAISGYLNASADLCGLLSATACHPSLRYSLERALSGVNLELSSLQSEEESLKETRITLTNERNRSRALSPVCKLPPEIFVTIFAIATSQYRRRDRTADYRTHVSPTIISSVSSLWRQIALGTPSLWSYIDFVIGSQPGALRRKQAELWVERSCNAVLYVNILECGSDFTQATRFRYAVAKLLEFLTPLMHRVCELEMGATLGGHDALSPVLALWSKRSSADIKKTLQVYNDDFEDPLGTPLGPASDGSFSTYELNSLLRSFNRLFLDKCRISEGVVFHEGLVELYLEYDDHPRPLTQHRFVAMLATCPRLRILVLANCWIQPSEVTPNPVALNHLQFLSLESHHHSCGFVHVLPLLAIGSEGLSMSLSMDDYCDFFEEARAFFGRTKVTRLYAWCIQGYVSLSALLYPIPYLETLVLDYFDISHDDIHNIVLWPRLRTLHLKDVSIDISCLQQLVRSQRSLTKLHVYQPATGGRSSRPMVGEERAHLADSMQMVEDFQIGRYDLGSCPITTWDFVILPQL